MQNVHFPWSHWDQHLWHCESCPLNLSSAVPFYTYKIAIFFLFGLADIGTSEPLPRLVQLSLAASPWIPVESWCVLAHKTHLRFLSGLCRLAGCLRLVSLLFLTVQVTFSLLLAHLQHNQIALSLQSVLQPLLPYLSSAHHLQQKTGEGSTEGGLTTNKLYTPVTRTGLNPGKMKNENYCRHISFIFRKRALSIVSRYWQFHGFATHLPWWAALSVVLTLW